MIVLGFERSLMWLVSSGRSLS
ncbi:unnamed protein product [Spirodela intermedia]|uniref:Uncharacterized protein n=1 Tax=Spirodela intermedia TaxID=51605 RepID=A0A7I8LBC3_SPIIN|nr:unnamed protein product [Spirodela intermedia]